MDAFRAHDDSSSGEGMEGMDLANVVEEPPSAAEARRLPAGSTQGESGGRRGRAPPPYPHSGGPHQPVSPCSRSAPERSALLRGARG